MQRQGTFAPCEPWFPDLLLQSADTEPIRESPQTAQAGGPNPKPLLFPSFREPNHKRDSFKQLEPPRR